MRQQYNNLLFIFSVVLFGGAPTFVRAFVGNGGGGGLGGQASRRGRQQPFHANTITIITTTATLAAEPKGATNTINTPNTATTTSREQQQQRQPSVESSSPSAIARENDIILYDGVCNFCNTWVDILLRIDLQKKFRFAPLQSSVGQELLVSIGKEADDISSVILVKAKTGESFDKSRCVLKVVEELGPVAALASRTALMAVPESIRDSIYDTVAENRYNLMGKRDECRCSDPEFADRFLLD